MDHQYGQFDSWEILSDTVAVKTCDKSFFSYNGSGVPKGVCWFFHAEDLEQGESIPIEILYNGMKYEGHVINESTDRKRTRVFWKSDLGKLLKEYCDTENLQAIFCRETESCYALVLKQKERGKTESMNNKELFWKMLSETSQIKYSPDVIINALQEGSEYCAIHGISKKSFWDIDDSQKFSEISSRLLSERIFRLKHKKTALILDKSVVLYKGFLKSRENDSTRSPEASEGAEYKSEQPVEEKNDAIEFQENETNSKVPASVSKDETAPPPPYVRTESDSILLEKYPVLFKRIYDALKEYGNICVTAQDVYETVGKVARLSTVKHVLDYASWCEHVNGNYRFSELTIHHNVHEATQAQSVNIGENSFYQWLENSKRMTPSDCHRFTSGINVLSRFLEKECGVVADLYTIHEPDELYFYFKMIKGHEAFIHLPGAQRDRLSLSFKYYTEYAKREQESKAKKTSSDARLKEKEFRQWAALRVGPANAKDYADVLKFIESRCILSRLIQKPFYEMTECSDLDRILDCVKTRKFPFILQKATQSDVFNAIPLYSEFLNKDKITVKDNALPKNAELLNFKELGDLSFTKPVRLRYKENVSTAFTNWADLYATLLFMLRVDHPRILADGTALSGSALPDISSDYQKMRAPKSIGKNLYVETNQDTKGILNRIVAALTLCGISYKNIEIYYAIKEKSLRTEGAKNKVSIDSQTLSKLRTYLKESSTGISLAALREKFPDLKLGALKAALETENAVMMNDKYYHRQNIEDYDEAAEIILSTLQSQFQREGGYTSAKMLYDELHVRLEDFFFDNGRFDSQVEIYDLARHFFETTKYKGYTFVFYDNKHIWEREPDYPKTYLGILSHWARMQKSIMTRAEMLERLVSMGVSAPQATFSWIMLGENQNPKEKLFMMFDEYRYVLTDSCGIDDDFISRVHMQLEELFAGDDYLAFDEIDDYFYSTLPDLPSGVYWTQHMMKSFLAFFDVGFFTVATAWNNDIKTPDAAIIRKNSVYKTFSDVLWMEINKEYDLPKDFDAEEFRQILLRKGFVHGMEKISNVNKTVEGDLRFLWTDNNSKVTVSKK